MICWNCCFYRGYCALSIEKEDLAVSCETFQPKEKKKHKRKKSYQNWKYQQNRLEKYQ
jgi:hypothetical protein